MSRTRNNTRLREQYLTWLEEQLRDQPDGRSFHDLVNLMFDKEFVFSIQTDENRVEDGLALRTEFAYATDGHINPTSMKNLGPCSFLEVVIGLSRRLAFNAGGSAPGWAWILLENLGLQNMTDPLRRTDEHNIDEIMDIVIRRAYKPDGTGGFFPLAWPDDDQSRIELWYQMHAYIKELNPDT